MDWDWCTRFLTARKVTVTYWRHPCELLQPVYASTFSSFLSAKNLCLDEDRKISRNLGFWTHIPSQKLEFYSKNHKIHQISLVCTKMFDQIGDVWCSTFLFLNEIYIFGPMCGYRISISISAWIKGPHVPTYLNEIGGLMSMSLRKVGPRGPLALIIENL